VRLPRSDAIYQSSIWIRHQMLAEPLEVDLPLSISASRLVLDVACLSVPSQEPTHRRFAYTEQRCSRCI